MAAKKTKVRAQTVYLGDCRSMAEVKDNSVDLIITSPPYWNLKDYGDSKAEIGKGSYEEYLEDLNAVWSECYRVAKPGGILVINVNSRRHKGKFYPIDFDIVARMLDWRFWDHNIWYIPNALPQPASYMDRLLDNKFESLLVFVKGEGNNYIFNKPRVPQKYIIADPRQGKKNPQGRCIGNILRIPAYRPPNIKQMGYHVAAFPEELVSFYTQLYTTEGGAILDPFLGSGTTLKVAASMGRSGVGYEVHEDYLPLIKSRINEYWAVPDWKSIDILHSSTMMTGTPTPRKAQFKRLDSKGLFDE